MDTQDARRLVTRILQKEDRGMPRHAAINSVCAGLDAAERAQVKQQLEFEIACTTKDFSKVQAAKVKS